MIKFLTLLAFIVISCTSKSSEIFDKPPLKNLPTKNSDTLKFTSGIRTILQDSQGNYWFGSHQEGVCIFNGNNFSYLTIKEGLPGNQIISITEIGFGIVCISTNNGLCTIESTTKKVSISNEYQNIEAKSIKVYATDVWSSIGNNFVKREIDKSFLFKNPFIQVGEKYPKDYGITCFTNGSNGNVWIGTYSGVIGFNGSFHSKITDSSLGFDGKNEYIHVRSIFEDSKGRLWIGNNGIGVLLKVGDSIINFSKQHQLFKGTPFKGPVIPGTLMHVFSIGEDAKGNIWFGDRDTGAWMYNGREMKNFVIDSSLRSQHIWCIYNDKQGNLLFGMAEKGVYKYDRNKFLKIY